MKDLQPTVFDDLKSIEFYAFITDDLVIIMEAARKMILNEDMFTAIVKRTTDEAHIKYQRGESLASLREWIYVDVVAQIVHQFTDELIAAKKALS